MEQRVVRRGHPVLGRLSVPVRVADVALDDLVPPLSVVSYMLAICSTIVTPVRYFDLSHKNANFLHLNLIQKK